MIDAATIGITLALNNGVSDGIAQIRRELAGLDAAVAASGMNLSRLVALAEGAGIAGATRAAAALAPVSPRPAAAALVVAATDPTAPTPPRAVPIGPAPALQRAPNTPFPAEPLRAARAPIPAPREATPPSSSAPMAAEIPGFAAFGRALAATPGEPARQPAMEAEPESLSGPEVAQTPPLAPLWPAAASRPEDDDAPFMALRAPVAPVANAPLASAPFMAPPVPPPVMERADAIRVGHPDGVEVSLDGTALARWINAELASQATRPPSGATAFDPRVSPAWPGLAGAA